MLRLPVVLLLATKAAYAEPAPSRDPIVPPTMTIGLSVYMHEFPTSGFHLAGAHHLGNSIYADMQASLGGHVRGDDASIESETLGSAQAGVSKLTWTRASAIGVRASLGYQKREVVYREALVADEPWTENDDMLYVEGAVLLRLRIAPSLAWEFLLAARVGMTTVDIGLGGTAVLSTGLHITI